MSNTEREKIIREIVRVFPASPVPAKVVKFQDELVSGSASLQAIVAGGGERGLSPGEGDKTGAFKIFFNRSWPEIKDSHFVMSWLEKGIDMTTYAPFGEPFYFLAPEAFRYYFPVWMKYCLDSEGQSVSESAGSLCRYLDRGEYAPLRFSEFDEKFMPFSEAQKVVVARFLSHVAKVFPADEGGKEAKSAYDSYWYQFDTDKPSPTQDKLLS